MMTKSCSVLFVFLLAIGLFSACSGDKKGDGAANANEEITEEKSLDSYFGAKITAQGAIGIDQLAATLGDSDSMRVKTKGKIVSVCQKKGCWMKVDMGEGKTMRVTFKDYGFFVPKDAAGKEVVLEGKVQKQLTDIETLRHYAEDEGKSEEEYGVHCFD